MEILGTKVEVVNKANGEPEAYVQTARSLSLAETERAVDTLSTIVELAFSHLDQPVELTYSAKTDIHI